LGFTNDDFPSTVVSPAYHDLLVGLICFDFVYFSIAAVDKVHTLLGSQVFWQCVQDDIIQFVHMQHVPSALFVEGSLIGDVGLFSIADPTGKPETAGDIIRRSIHPAPGNESIVEGLLSNLESKVKLFGDADKMDVANQVRASVMMPEIARLLGIGEAILPIQMPKWLVFPYLRMAHLVTLARCAIGWAYRLQRFRSGANGSRAPLLEYSPPQNQRITMRATC